MLNAADDNVQDDQLDAGLRAAFSGRQAGGNEPPTVIARLRDRYGIGQLVMLRDEDPEDGAIIRPRGSSSQGMFGDRYQVHGEIARGGMGVVLKGRDVDLGRDVAIKTLQSELSDDPAMVARFVEEAQIAGQLQHPGILPVYELGIQQDQTPYFVMKLIKGRTLGEMITQRGSAQDHDAHLLTIFQQVCQTVGYAHARGVVHRDLKPSNILVGAFGEVQVVDWGLAKLIRRGGASEDQRKTRPMQTSIETVRSSKPGSASVAGSVLGTPAYMAPEQARGDVDQIDERTDVFALGAILFELLTGSPPKFAERHTAMQEIRSVLNSEKIDAELADIVLSCVSPAMDARPRNAKIIADRLGAYTASVERRARDSMIEAAEASAREQEERRRRRLTIAASIALLAAASVIAAGAWTIHSDRQQQVREATARLSRSVSEAGELLGVATTARLNDGSAWTMLESARTKIADSLHVEDVEPEVAALASDMLSRIDNSARDRRLAELIEDVVIHAATHYDPTSWLRMEQQLRGVLLDFEIDLNTMESDEIAERIREHPARIMLADCLELWIGTLGSLDSMGVTNRPLSEFAQWVETLLAADPDPVRVQIRQLVFGSLLEPGSVSREQVDALYDSLELSEVHPRSLSWLAGTYYVLGDAERLSETYREICDAWPGDLMVSYDAGFMATSQGRWEHAIRYYMRCIAIDDRVGGVWRQLGVAYRQTGELAASIDALQRAIDLQPKHHPTYADLAWSFIAAGKLLEAEQTADEAIELGGEDDPALHAARGRALHLQQRWSEAVRAYERSLETQAGNPAVDVPVADWLAECRAASASTVGSQGAGVRVSAHG